MNKKNKITKNETSISSSSLTGRTSVSKSNFQIEPVEYKKSLKTSIK